MLTIFQLLEQGTIVAWDEELGLLVLWNGSLTLRMFRVREYDVRTDARGIIQSHIFHDFEEIDGHTMTERHVRKRDQKITLVGAKRKAEKWLKQLIDEEEQGCSAPKNNATMMK